MAPPQTRSSTTPSIPRIRSSSTTPFSITPQTPRIRSSSTTPFSITPQTRSMIALIRFAPKRPICANGGYGGSAFPAIPVPSPLVPFAGGKGGGSDGGKAAGGAGGENGDEKNDEKKIMLLSWLVSWLALRETSIVAWVTIFDFAWQFLLRIQKAVKEKTKEADEKKKEADEKKKEADEKAKYNSFLECGRDIASAIRQGASEEGKGKAVANAIAVDNALKKKNNVSDVSGKKKWWSWWSRK